MHNVLFQVADGSGRAARLVLWNQPGTDITGMVARCEKMVNTCEQARYFTHNFCI